MVVRSALNHVTQLPNSKRVVEYTFCDYLNISVCPATETAKSFTVTVYNPVARNVDTNIRVPVSSKSVRVYGPNGKPVPFTIQSVTNVTKYVRGNLGNAPYELIFPAVNLPPLGLAVYGVNVSSNGKKSSPNTHHTTGREIIDLKANSSDYVIENEHLRLTFSSKNGRLVKFENVDFQISEPVDQQFFWYNSSVGNNISGQASDAYNFRPNSSTPFNISEKNQAKITAVLKNSIVQEIQQVFSPWVSQVVRLYSNKPYAEFEYTVGPIEMDPSRELGKEVISRFETRLKTDGVFYTDANGREMQMRKRNYRPTWSYEGA